MRSHDPEWEIPVASIGFDPRHEVSTNEQTGNASVERLEPDRDIANELPVAAPPMATYLYHDQGPRPVSHTKAPDIVSSEDISASVAAAIAHATAQAALDQKQTSDETSEGEESSNGEEDPTMIAVTGVGFRESGQDEHNAELDAWVNQGMVDDTPAG